MFQRHVLVDAKAAHQARRRIAAEAPHQFIFKRQIKGRVTGIALTGRAATQLIVDAPRFVALGADDAQSAEFAHTLPILLAAS